MAIEITVIPSGRVKVKDTTTGGIAYFSNENHAAQIQGDNVVIVNQARTLNPDYVIAPSQVTAPTGPWTAETLCEWLNTSPRFFKSAGGGGGGGITSVDTLDPIVGNGINPDPVRIDDGTTDGDTLCWNAGTGAWVIDGQLVNQRLADLRSGIFNAAPLEDASDDLSTGTPYDKAVHQRTDINPGGVSTQYTSGVTDGTGAGATWGAVVGAITVVETPGSEHASTAAWVALQDQLAGISQKTNPINSRLGLVQFALTNNDGLGNTPFPTLTEAYSLQSDDANEGTAYRRVASATENSRHRFRNEFEFDRVVLLGNSEADTSYAALEYKDGSGSAHTEANDRTTVDESTPVVMWIDPVDAGATPWSDGTRLSVEFTVQVASTLNTQSFYVKGICFYIKNGGTGNWDAVFAHTDGTYNAQEKITNMVSEPTVSFNVTSGGQPFALSVDPSTGSFGTEQVRVSSFVKRIVTSLL